MNWADYCILAVLGLSVVIGLWRGLISEVMALACWAAAFWVAWMFGDKLAALFTSIEVPSVRLLLGYGLCFLGVLVAGALVAFVVRKLVAGSGLSGTDRLLGMMFGLARGVLLVLLAVLLLGFTPFPRDPWWQQSRLMPGFQNGAEWLAAKLPDNVTKYLDYRGLLTLPALQGKPAAPSSPPPVEAGAAKNSSS
ncbi:CvpA family protein [Tahibacter sp.]|uniref:CvpA family protein n=1 Tax=Tahibacter sp. TaxID=2056211 RepID=UPI0028C3D269|nr:CvpA family protein [Tahibacter sp.]